MHLRTCSTLALSMLLLSLAAHPSQAAILTNGSFETGDFTGFTRDAFLNFNTPASAIPNYQTFLTAQTDSSRTTVADSNAVVMSQTATFDGTGTPGPAVLPTNGNFLAFLSNETTAGDFSLTGSSISQTFTIPAGSTTFSFDIALLNDDTMPAATFDDFGGLALLSGSTVLSQYNIDLTGLGNNSVQVGTHRGGFLNSTPFTGVNFNVSGLQGQTVTLVAYVAQVGDNTVESRLLLDNLRLSGVTAIPEPSSLSLLVLPLLTLAKRYVKLR
jgi:hypothetical protein